MSMQRVTIRKNSGYFPCKFEITATAEGNDNLDKYLVSSLRLVEQWLAQWVVFIMFFTSLVSMGE